MDQIELQLAFPVCLLMPGATRRAIQGTMSPACYSMPPPFVSRLRSLMKNLRMNGGAVQQSRCRRELRFTLGFLIVRRASQRADRVNVASTFHAVLGNGHRGVIQQIRPIASFISVARKEEIERLKATSFIESSRPSESVFIFLFSSHRRSRLICIQMG